MQKSLIIILLLIFNLTFGQEKIDPTESLISEFKTEMEEQGVSDFFVLKRITYGTAYIFDLDDPNLCNPKGVYFTMYAFWKNGKESYVKKFDNCGGFNSIKLTNSKPLEFFKNNFVNLNEQEVEKYKFKPDSFAKGKTYSFNTTQSHSPLRYYWFCQDKIQFDKNFDKFDLTTKPNNKNLNFESNNSLAIVKLNAICEEIIDGLNEKKMFNRINQKGKYQASSFEDCGTGGIEEIDYKFRIGDWIFYHPNGEIKATGKFKTIQTEISSRCDLNEKLTFSIIDDSWSFFDNNGKKNEPSEETINELNCVTQKIDGDLEIQYCFDKIQNRVIHNILIK